MNNIIKNNIIKEEINQNLIIPKIVDSLPIKISYCLFYFKDGNIRRISKEEEEVFPAASIVKIPLAVYIFKLYEQNKIDINREIDITNINKVGGAGIIKDLNLSKIKIIDLITLAIIISDNTASNILIDLIEKIEGAPFKILNSYFKSLNLNKTTINRKFMTDLISPPVNFTTTFEINYLLYKLLNFELLNKENTLKLIEIMSKQQYTEKIPLYLDNYYIANKTGDIDGISLDSAIIFKSNNFEQEIKNKNYYIISIFTKFGNFTSCNKTSRNIVNNIISEIAYNLIKTIN
ncbi:MAG: serine hydrolase [bacterium]